MIKFKHKEKTDDLFPYKYAQNIPVGCTFYAENSTCKGYFLKTFSKVVFLNNPNLTWGDDYPSREGFKNWRFCDLEVIEVAEEEA